MARGRPKTNAPCPPSATACWWFHNDGTCKFGSKCRFAHSPSDDVQGAPADLHAQCDKEQGHDPWAGWPGFAQSSASSGKTVVKLLESELESAQAKLHAARSAEDLAAQRESARLKAALADSNAMIVEMTKEKESLAHRLQQAQHALSKYKIEKDDWVDELRRVRQSQGEAESEISILKAELLARTGVNSNQPRVAEVHAETGFCWQFHVFGDE